MSAVKQTEKGYILVIDDDPLLIKTLKKTLSREGYFVDTASGGEEGIRKARSGFFHLVLCDIRMPGLTGLMTIRHIQKFQEQAGIDHSGFVVITAYDTEDYRAQAYQLGVTDFIKKPFQLEAFLDVVRHNIDPVLREVSAADVSELNKRLTRLLEEVHT